MMVSQQSLLGELQTRKIISENKMVPGEQHQRMISGLYTHAYVHPLHIYAHPLTYKDLDLSTWSDM